MSNPLTFEAAQAQHEAKANCLKKIAKLEKGLEDLGRVTNINLFAPGSKIPCAGACILPSKDEDYAPDPAVAATENYIAELARIKRNRIEDLKTKFLTL